MSGRRLRRQKSGRPGRDSAPGSSTLCSAASPQLSSGSFSSPQGPPPGVHHLNPATVADAAEALRPIAGPYAGDLFAVGLLASAVVALPVIMATTAYVTGALLNWRRGLSLKISEAPRFYAALAAAATLGTGLAFSGISPIQLLFIAGVIAGIATPIGLAALLVIASNRKLMEVVRWVGFYWPPAGRPRP